MPKIKFQPTPNPDSLKITAEGRVFIPNGMRTFSSRLEAEGDLLGERLFALPGVANLFILPQFLTVTKHPAADWDDLEPKIELALEAYFDEEAA